MQDEQPEVCALSVCMPEGLPACYSTVKAIKKAFPAIIVIIGGRAFVQVGTPLTKINEKIKSIEDAYCKLEKLKII